MFYTGDSSLGIYIHIPFCMSKCAYCDFYSFVPNGENIFERYTNALCTHMSYYKESAKDRIVDTVFIGGGTPTVLPTECLVKILKCVKKNFKVAKGAEISIEVNPATADKKKFARLRRAGVNRVSIGLQSANANELKALSRAHTLMEFEECYEAAREAKIDNINVDVMFGIPLQTEDSFLRTVDYVTRLSPEHISVYDLKIEPNTKFGRMANELILPDEDTEYSMYAKAIKLLATRGYKQYEISNFAREGRECLHNLRYWNCKDYLGFGPGAHSFFNQNRYSFVRHAEKYMNGVENMQHTAGITDYSEQITGRAGMGEYIMLRLRLCEGIVYKDFYMRYGVDFRELYGQKLDYYVKNRFMKETGEGIALTYAGMFVSNYILSDILSFEDLNAISPARRF